MPERFRAAQKNISISYEYRTVCNNVPVIGELETIGHGRLNILNSKYETALAFLEPMRQFSPQFRNPETFLLSQFGALLP
jgi:hypothetical protein